MIDVPTTTLLWMHSLLVVAILLIIRTLKGHSQKAITAEVVTWEEPTAVATPNNFCH